MRKVKVTPKEGRDCNCETGTFALLLLGNRNINFFG